MADEYVIRIVPESVSSGSSKKGGDGGLLGGLGGKLGAILAVAGIAMSIIKPMLPMIKGLGKMIGEFLRPIAEILMMLLAPVLALMRPILITFKALMAPFKQAAMTAIAAGQKLIGQGMALGGDTPEGSALIGEGFAGSLSGASLMFSGFVETIFTPLAEMFGLGEQFASAMDNWQNKALTGVFRVNMLSDTIDIFGATLLDVRESAKEALGTIDNQMNLLIESVGTFTIENFEADMNTVQTVIEATSALLVGDIDALKLAADELNVPMESVIGTLMTGIDPTTQFATGIDNIVTALDSATQMQIAYQNALGIGDKIESTKPGFWSKLWGSIKEPMGNGVGFFESFGVGWRGVSEDWEATSQSLIDQHNVYWKTKLPESQYAGLEEMRIMMDKYMGKSVIPDLMEDGFIHITDSTNGFVSSMKTMATTMDDLAKDVAASAKAAAKSAASAASSSRRASANSSSLWSLF